MAKDDKEKLETIDAEPAEDKDTNKKSCNKEDQQEKETTKNNCKNDKESKEIDQDLLQLKEQLQRVQAEFMNYKKRVERDRENMIQFANEKLVIDLIQVLDNFHRALDSEKEHDSFYEGMELILDQLTKLLEDYGVEEFSADGEKFDHNLHNAVLMEESEEIESGNVIETLQKGYKLNGKLVRPAMVKVAK